MISLAEIDWQRMSEAEIDDFLLANSGDDNQLGAALQAVELNRPDLSRLLDEHITSIAPFYEHSKNTYLASRAKRAMRKLNGERLNDELKELYPDLIGAELSNDSGTLFAIILPDAGERGKYRGSFFDENGFSGHRTRDTAEDVLKELKIDGYRKIATGSLERLSATERFMAGNRAASDVEALNSGRLTWNEFMARRVQKEQANPSVEAELNGHGKDIVTEEKNMSLPINSLSVDFPLQKGFVIVSSEDMEILGGDKGAIRNYKNSPANLSFAKGAASYYAIRDKKYYAVIEGNAFMQQGYQITVTANLHYALGAIVDEFDMIVVAPNGKLTKHKVMSESAWQAKQLEQSGDGFDTSIADKIINDDKQPTPAEIKGSVSPDNYNERVRADEQAALKRQLESTSTIYSSSGKPFKTEKTAHNFLESNDLVLSHKVTSVGDGFVLSQLSPAARAEAIRLSEGRESWMDAQTVVLDDLGFRANADGEYDLTDDEWASVERLIALRLKDSDNYVDAVNAELSSFLRESYETAAHKAADRLQKLWDYFDENKKKNPYLGEFQPEIQDAINGLRGNNSVVNVIETMRSVSDKLHEKKYVPISFLVLEIIEPLESFANQSFAMDGSIEVADTKDKYTEANSIVGSIEARFTNNDDIKNKLENGMFVMNAPRPLMGDVTFTSDFIAGRFYAILDPLSEDFERFAAANNNLDATMILYANQDEQRLMIINKSDYRNEYLELVKEGNASKVDGAVANIYGLNYTDAALLINQAREQLGALSLADYANVVLSKSDNENISDNLPTADITMRSDGMFTSFIPNTKAGEHVFSVMAKETNNTGKVLDIHAAAVVQQIQEAGYTVSSESPKGLWNDLTDDELLSELTESPIQKTIAGSDTEKKGKSMNEQSNVVSIAAWQKKSIVAGGNQDAVADSARNTLIGLIVEYMPVAALYQHVNASSIGTNFELLSLKKEVDRLKKNVDDFAIKNGLGLDYDELPIDAEIKRVREIVSFIKHGSALIKSDEKNRSYLDVWSTFHSEFRSFITSDNDEERNEATQKFIASGDDVSVSLFGLSIMKSDFNAGWAILHKHFNFPGHGLAFNRILNIPAIEYSGLMLSSLDKATQIVINSLPDNCRLEAITVIKNESEHYMVQILDTVDVEKYFNSITEMESLYKYDIDSMDVSEDDKLICRAHDAIDEYMDKYKFDYYAARRMEAKVRAVINKEFDEHFAASKAAELIGGLRKEISNAFGDEYIDFKGHRDNNSRLFISTIVRLDGHISINLESDMQGDWVNGDFSLFISSTDNTHFLTNKSVSSETFKIPQFNSQLQAEAINQISKQLSALPKTGIKHKALLDLEASLRKSEESRDDSKEGLAKRLNTAVECGALPATVKFTISEPHYKNYKIKISALPEGMGIFGDGVRNYIKENPHFSYWDHDSDSPMRDTPAFFALKNAIERIAKVGRVCTDDGDNGNYPVLHNFNLDVDTSNKLYDEMVARNVEDFTNGIKRNDFSFSEIDYAAQNSGKDVYQKNMECLAKIESGLDKCQDLMKLSSWYKELGDIKRNGLFSKGKSFGLLSPKEILEEVNKKEEMIKLKINEMVTAHHGASYSNCLGKLNETNPALVAALKQLDYVLVVGDISHTSGLPISVSHTFGLNNGHNGERHNIVDITVKPMESEAVESFNAYSAESINLAVTHSTGRFFYNMSAHYFAKNTNLIFSEFEPYSYHTDENAKIRSAFEKLKELRKENSLSEQQLYPAFDILRKSNVWVSDVSAQVHDCKKEKYLTISDGHLIKCVNTNGEMIELTKEQYTLLESALDLPVSNDVCQEWIDNGSAIYQINVDSMRNYRVAIDSSNTYHLINVTSGESSELNAAQQEKIQSLIDQAGEALHKSASMTLH